MSLLNLSLSLSLCIHTHTYIRRERVGCTNVHGLATFDLFSQDPPPDPVDYLVKLEASKRSSELGTVDINDSTADILFSQSGSSQSTPSSQSLTGSHVNTPWGSSHSTPQGTPLKNVQNKSTKPVAVSPLVLIDFSQTPDSPSSALEPAQIILNGQYFTMQVHIIQRHTCWKNQARMSNK